MKIRVLSDLHLEFQDWHPPPADADVVVLAGDIDIGSRALQWARAEFGDLPIVYVPGNHEYFGSDIETMLAHLRHSAEELGILLLDENAAMVQGVKFLGATLWTDFAFYGAGGHIERAMQRAVRGMRDYDLIGRAPGIALTPSMTREIHLRQVAWLARELDASSSQTVVVTHHLPHPKSVHARYARDAMNAAFVSDLSRYVKDPVRLWIHGHTHESIRFRENGTEVVCNPRGYLPQEPNPAFDEILVVDIGGTQS